MKLVKVRNACIAALACAVGVGTAQVVVAAPPEKIHYQGDLRDDQGDPITDSVDFEFRVFSSASGGTALWTETHTGVAVEAGLFQVVLGSTQALPASVFETGDRWLETVVEGAPLVPRRQFLSTPYALRAAVADVALSGGGADEDWVISGSNVYRLNGNVGIGEDGPLSKLHIETSDLGIDAGDVGPNTSILVESTDANLILLSNTAGGTGSGVGLSEVSGGSVVNTWAMRRQTTGAGGALQFTHTDGANVVNFLPDSRVGIGTATPSAELHIYESDNVDADLLLEKVAGSTVEMTAANSSGSVGTFSNHPFRLLSNNSVRMHIDTAGNIGVGTINPTAKMDVAGTLVADEVVGDNLRTGTTLGSGGTPDAGRVYSDNVVYAWAQIRGDGVIEASYGVDSVARLSNGWYRVTYKRSLPNGAAPVAIAYSANDIVNTRISSSTSTRCEVRTALWIPGNGDFSASDYRFIVQVTGRP